MKGKSIVKSFAGDALIVQKRIMKKRLLSILLALSLVASFMPYSLVSAEAVDDGIPSETFELSEYESLAEESDLLECDVDLAEGDEDSLEIDEEVVINNLNIANGIPQSSEVSELGAPIDDECDETGEQDAIEAELPENGNENSVERTAPEGSYETNASTPSVSVSSSSVSLNKGNSAKVTVSYSGYNGCIYLQYAISNSMVSCNWGDWNGNKIPITITGKSAGTATVTIYLKAYSTGKTLATKTISVSVKNSVSLSLSKTDFDTVYGKTTSVKATAAGISSGMKICYSISSGSSVSCSWGSWSGSTIPLNIKGTGSGTSKVTVSIRNSSGTVLISKVITVYVTKSATLNLSASTLKLNVGSTSNISVSYSNAYGRLYATYSLSNSFASCSWSGWKLLISSKKPGTTTITVSLYNNSGDKLAQKNITLNGSEKASLSCSVPSLSLKNGTSTSIKYTFSGTSASVYYNYSISNTSVCSASWTGSWSGNSHALKVSGKNPGTTTLTVYLKRSSDNATLASKSITVKVEGTPAVTLSVSSASIKVGEQFVITATGKNISTDYSMSYGTSGGCFSASWNSSTITNNQVKLTIKGTKSGSGTLTVYLKVSGSVVASKSISVTVKPGDNPQLSFSSSTLSVNRGSYAINKISYSGTSENIYMSYSLSNSNVTASWQGWSGSTNPLKITGVKTGSTTVTIKLIKSSNNSVLASKTFSVAVLVDPGPEIKKLSYKFDNYTTYIPESTFKLAYGNNTKAERLYKAYTYANGVCYGMAATAMMLRNGTYLTPSLFGQSSILSLSKSSSNSTYNMKLNTFIELMYITQFSTTDSSNEVSGINNVCKQVAAGNRVLLSFWGPYNGKTGGHTVVAYMLDESNNRLYISDSNYPGGTTRYLSLTKNSSGTYTGWSYNLFGSVTWNNSNGKISYINQSTVNSMWNNRGKLSVASGWLSSNMLLTNSDDFVVYDVEGQRVASYSNGDFSSEIEEAAHIIPCSINPNSDFEYEYNLFYLPTEYYTIENKDNSIDSFIAEMISEDLGVSVETTASLVSFAVDDDTNLCNTNLSLNEDDSYAVNMMSSREGEDDISVDGIGFMDNTNLSFSMTNGVLNHSETIGASINIDDVGENYYSIEATASDGGKISPNGISNPLKNRDLTYTITPDNGFEIADVLVNGESVGIVNEYTFSQIESDAALEVVFEPDHVHEFEWISNNDATFEKDGTKTQVCKICGYRNESSTTTDTGSKKSVRVSIINYKNIEVDLKSKVILHASVSEPGCRIVWYNAVTNQKIQDGDTYEVSQAKSSFSVYAVAVDNSNNILSKSDVETVTVKTGFFQTVIAFFRGLFKALPVWIDNSKK